MPLSQLQGLNPLGGSSGYGMGRPPNGDGTNPNYPDDPNNPNSPNNQHQPRRPQNGAPSSYQGPSSSTPQSQTFAQMQAQGRARPAPPMQQAPQGGNGLLGQAQQSASQALQNPSAYGAPQVQQSIDALNQNLAVQDRLGRRQIDETMAQRGLYDSTATGDKYGMLAQQESAQRAQLAANLSQQVAQTYGQDRATALQSALATQGQQFGQGMSQQQLQLQQTLGYGGLGLQAQQQQQNYALGSAGLTGQFNGQSTLGAQQLGLQNQQFQQSLGLQSQLGLGQLGISQEQANTQQAGTLGNLALGQQQLGQQQSQFGQSFGLQQLQNQQQYGLSQQQLALQQTLGYGNLGLAQQTQSQNNALAQRGLDLQQAYQGGQLGLGQSQINASLLNEQRQAMGNLAYAGLLNGQAPSQDWLNFLMSNQGQNTGSPYNYNPTQYGGYSPNGPAPVQYGTGMPNGFTWANGSPYPGASTNAAPNNPYSGGGSGSGVVGPGQTSPDMQSLFDYIAQSPYANQNVQYGPHGEVMDATNGKMLSGENPQLAALLGAATQGASYGQKPPSTSSSLTQSLGYGQQPPQSSSALQQQWSTGGRILPSMSQEDFYSQYPNATPDDWKQYGNRYGVLPSQSGAQ